MKSKQPFINSLSNAFVGIVETINTERNFRIHVVIGLIVFTLSLIFNLSSIELIIVVITVGLVLALEMINTAIEILSDEVDLNYNESIKKVKDTSAGAVLIFSIFAVIVGLLIFIPKLVNLI